MKVSSLRRLVVAAVGVAALSAGVAMAADDAHSEKKMPFVRVSPRDARYFELSDGRPYIPIGLNMIQPPRGAKQEDLGPMADWIKSLAANRGNFIRVWLSAPYFDVEHEKSGRYDEARFARIFDLLNLCRAQGVRVKMCLEHFRTLEGGKEWSRKDLHLVENGGPATDAADFFADEKGRRQFKRKLTWFADRFGDRPAVFGWELWNEVNCVRGADWYAWSEVMLADLHRKFRRNLAMQSLGSFDRDSGRAMYRRLVALPGNDVAQVHRYLDLGAALEVCRGPVDVLAADAVREILTMKPGRPVLLAESGAVEPNHSGPFKLYAKDSAGLILHDVLFAPFFAGAAGPGHIWHWDHYVAKNDLWRHFGRFAEAVDGIDPPAEGFKAGMIEHPRLRIYTLTGRRTFLAWLRDGENTWQAELADGKPPRPVAGAVLALPAGVPGLDGARLRTYDPWTNTWVPAEAAGGKVALPAFTRSLVVRIDAAR